MPAAIQLRLGCDSDSFRMRETYDFFIFHVPNSHQISILLMGRPHVGFSIALEEQVMNRPHGRAPALFRLPPYADVPKALGILLEAFKEAQDTNQPTWEYAAELRNFLNVGVPTFTLRWLMDKGIFEHGYEQARGHSGRRRFRRVNSHVFKENSCFVLKAEAVGKVREALLEASVHLPESGGPPGPGDNYFLFEVPVWNKASGQLWYENDLVKELSGTAVNQRRVLDACHENCWRQPVPNPFHGSGHECLSEPLHNTLERLNGKQIHRLLYFYRDGTGKGFRWKPLDPDES
jgi:hypothetical protein